MLSRRPSSDVERRRRDQFFSRRYAVAPASRASARKLRRRRVTHGPVSRAGDGFFINCWVCRRTATGAGGAKPEASARHVRTLIALERAITSPRLRVKIAGKVDVTRQAILGSGFSEDPVSSLANSLSRVEVLRRPRETNHKKHLHETRPKRRRRARITPDLQRECGPSNCSPRPAPPAPIHLVQE